MSLLTMTGVDISYRRNGLSRRYTDPVVSGLDLRIDSGEVLALVGESGSGKSTIGRAILGLADLTAGTMEFEGTDITRAGRATRRRLSRDIQVVFQDPYNSLNPARTIGQTLVEPMIVHDKDMPRAQRRERITELLAMVSLDQSAATKYPSQFSGGQRQRIAIARALALTPKLIVCDEPVSALDLSIQAQVLNLLMDIQKRLHLSLLLISHDLSIVEHMAARAIVLHRGRVVEEGDALEIARNPSDPYTRTLVDSVPLLDPRAQRARRATAYERTE